MHATTYTINYSPPKQPSAKLGYEMEQHRPPDYPYLFEAPADGSLAAGWLQQFPGDSHLIKSLRETLIEADRRRLLTHGALTQLELDLYYTGLPRRYWDARAYGQLHLVQTCARKARRDFEQTLNIMHFHNTQAHKPDPKTPKLLLPKPAPPISWGQYIKITVEDGKILSTVEFDANFFLTQTWENLTEVARCFYFPDAVIPEPYQWVLEEDDEIFPPTPYIKIFYEGKVFLDLCREEVKTKSEYFLPGSSIIDVVRGDTGNEPFPSED